MRLCVALYKYIQNIILYKCPVCFKAYAFNVLQVIKIITIIIAHNSTHTHTQVCLLSFYVVLMWLKSFLKSISWHEFAKCWLMYLCVSLCTCTCATRFRSRISNMSGTVVHINETFIRFHIVCVQIIFSLFRAMSVNQYTNAKCRSFSLSPRLALSVCLSICCCFFSTFSDCANVSDAIKTITSIVFWRRPFIRMSSSIHTSTTYKKCIAFSILMTVRVVTTSEKYSNFAILK